MQVEILPTEPVDLIKLGPTNGTPWINWQRTLQDILAARPGLDIRKYYAVECQYQYYTNKARTKTTNKKMRYLFKINLYSENGDRYVVTSQFPDVLPFPKETS